MARSDPHELLESALRDWVGGPLPEDPPSRWERFADVAILPPGSFADRAWGPGMGSGRQ